MFVVILRSHKFPSNLFPEMDPSIGHIREQIRKVIDSLYMRDFCFAKEVVIEGLIGITLDR